MSTSTQDRAARRPARLATFATIALIGLATTATRSANAEEALDGPGAGTEFLNCQNHAWADYNKCLTGSAYNWEMKLCDLSFEADITWCASVYYRRLKTGT